MKIQEFKFKDATKKEIDAQFNLRRKGFRSNGMAAMAEYFMANGIHRNIDLSELVEFVSTEKGRVYTMVEQLNITHGFDIVNHSIIGRAGSYQLVGFTLRKRDQDKKIIKAENAEQKLINGVFCL